ncbi:hypothetical protein EUGRSUZ_I01652 [Eucalyptus grandis]|uniref:Uncharacterized protein n=2 Tax=Eucalyptus grandis TaxID=71139 RepID=A0ACC3JH39_EUCGR|nr:hypothetical protein EUGRSUZ_I01652 [Eucalyptus grandis]
MTRNECGRHSESYAIFQTFVRICSNRYAARERFLQFKAEFVRLKQRLSWMARKRSNVSIGSFLASFLSSTF